MNLSGEGKGCIGSERRRERGEGVGAEEGSDMDRASAIADQEDACEVDLEC